MLLYKFSEDLLKMKNVYFSPFYTVSHHMSPQRTWDRAGKFTLAAFVWLFSTVGFQMCPQMACMRRGIVTLLAFVWFNYIVSLFLQDFLTLQTKVIILISLFHCVVFCSNGSFKLIHSNDWLLFNNHNLTFPWHTFTF